MKSSRTKTVLGLAAVALAAIVLSAGPANAGVLPVTGITGHDGGNWPNWHGHLSDMVNGLDATIIDTGTGDDRTMSGMKTTAVDPGDLQDPADPATWTWSGSYKETWHANSVLAGAGDPDQGIDPAINNKLGWVVMDLGSVVANLDNAYFWASGGAGDAEKVDGYNLYLSSGVGIDALSAMPKSQAKTGDYDFSSGDWALVKAGNLGTAVGALDSTVSLGGASAQYIGIEITSLHGTGNRMAIAQIEFTQIPEPATMALLGIGGLMVLRRRRRA